MCGGPSHLKPPEHSVQQIAERVEDIKDGTQDLERLDKESGVAQGQVCEHKAEPGEGRGVPSEGPPHRLQRPGRDDRQPFSFATIKPLAERGEVVQLAISRPRGIADVGARQDVEELAEMRHGGVGETVLIPVCGSEVLE